MRALFDGFEDWFRRLKVENDSHTQATSPLPEAPLRLPLAPATSVASRRRAILKIARKWGRVDDMTGVQP